MLFFFLYLASVCIFSLSKKQKKLPDEKIFLRQVFEKIRQWEKNPPRPTYREHRVTYFYSGDKIKSKLDEIYHITWYRGKPVYVLEKKNGKTLSNSSMKFQEKLKKEEINKEIAHPSKKEKVEAIYLTPLLNKYTYRILGCEKVWGRPAIKISFKPISGKFRGKKISSRILEKTIGYAWIDETEKEVVKVKAWLSSPVHIGWGIIANINPLELEYHRKLLHCGIWFESSLAVRVKVKFFFFTRYDRLVKSTIFDVECKKERPSEQ